MLLTLVLVPPWWDFVIKDERARLAWAGLVVDVNRKNRKPFISVGFCRVFPTENRLFQLFFRLPKQTKQTNRRVFFRSILFYSPQQQKKRRKPTDIFRCKTGKPTVPFFSLPVYFRFTTNPGRHMIPTHTTSYAYSHPLKGCLNGWFNRETDREVFGFVFYFFGFQKRRPKPTDSPVRKRKPTEAIFIFGSQLGAWVCHGVLIHRTRYMVAIGCISWWSGETRTCATKILKN